MTAKKRNPAAGDGGGSTTGLGGGQYVNSSAIDRAAADADERALIDLLDRATELGCVIARRCRRCRHPMSDRRSVLAGIGPRCATLEGGAR